MDKSMLVGTVFGVGIATALGGVAGYRMLSGPEYARVVSVEPVTEKVETPREECHDQVVTRQKPVKDKHQITGTVVGAVGGAVCQRRDSPVGRQGRILALRGGSVCTCCQHGTGIFIKPRFGRPHANLVGRS